MNYLETFDRIIEKYSQDKVRNKYYEKLKKDPIRWKKTIEQAKIRGQKHRNKIHNEYIEKRKDLKTLKFIDKENKHILDEEYQNINHPHLEKEKSKAKALVDKTKANTLNGLLIKLYRAFATQKSTVKQTISDKIEKQILSRDSDILPQFKAFQEEWYIADQKNDKAAKVAIIQNMRKTISNYAEQQNLVIYFVEIIKEFKEWKNSLDIIDSMLQKDITDSILIINCLNEGYELITKYKGHNYLFRILEITKEIVGYLNSINLSDK